MLNNLDNLPNDTADLHGLVGQMANEIKSQALLIAGSCAIRLQGKTHIALDQMQLRLEDEEVAEAPAEPIEQTVEGVKVKPKHKALPRHLPRVEQVLCAGDACTDCGGTLRELGRVTTEELEYVPGRFVVNLIIRPRMA